MVMRLPMSLLELPGAVFVLDIVGSLAWGASETHIEKERDE
jgi:hypothetical protein